MDKKVWKRLLAVLLSAALLIGAMPVALAAEAGEDGQWTWEQTDNSTVTAALSRQSVAEKEEEPPYAEGETVRVSIVLEDKPTLLRFPKAADGDIASNTAAKTYRSKLEAQQDAMANTISREVLQGKKLDVVWNLTLAANIISANVEYGKLEEIKALEGVKDVFVETQYEPMVASVGGDDPNMQISSDMTGTTQAWNNKYKGQGMRVAIIDTGLKTEHQSMNAAAFDHALEEDATADGKTVADYKLLNQAEIQSKLTQLNAYKRDGAKVTAAQLYRTTKIPYGYAYVDKDLDITHDNDTQGDHGSHVAGIATANRYLKKADGTFASAMDEVHMTGDAPDAQVLVMKVFGNNGGAYDSDYMVAIEDAVVLGCDTINLSLGSGNPGTAAYGNDEYQKILDSFVKYQSLVVISAGNSGTWAESSEVGALYSDDASFDMVGSPGSYTNAFTVASVDNNGMIGMGFTYGSGTLVIPTDTVGNFSALDVSADKSGTALDYVYLDKIGAAADYTSDVTGKVVFVNRGDTSFVEKATVAFQKGAAACIVVNNQPGTISMALDDFVNAGGTMPCVSITQAEGQAIKATGATGQITVLGSSKVMNGSASSPDYTMSDFSSWGVPGDLSLKPEITAPGGNIWSLYGTGTDNGKYQLMSGTSMAAPQIAGIGALVKQYIETQELSQEGLTDRALAQSLIMSTATPLKDGAGKYQSILNQGAGMVNTAAATSADSYVLVDGQEDGKVKVEWGDDPAKAGKYSVKFTINNMDHKARSYQLSEQLFTQATQSDAYGTYWQLGTQNLASTVTWVVDQTGGIDFNNDGVTNIDDAQALLDYVVKGTALKKDEDKADVNNDGTVNTADVAKFLQDIALAADEPVTVPADGSLTVYGEITLDASAAEAVLAKAPNGFYVEGYITVEAQPDSEGAVGTGHSIPMLGWYGSWSAPSMFDKGSYAEYYHETGEERAPYLYTGVDENGYPIPQIDGNYLTVKYGDGSGVSPFIGNTFLKDDQYLEERNALNSQNGDQLDNWSFALIRNASASRLTITDANTGAVYKSQELGDAEAAFYYSNESTWMKTSLAAPVSWAGTDAKGKPLAEDTVVDLNLTLVPEYYVDGNTVRWEELEEGASLTTRLTIDNTPPTLKTVEGAASADKKLTLEAQDNQYVAAIALFDASGKKLLSAETPNQTEKGAVASVTLDVDGIVGKRFKVQVFDYAGNTATFDVAYTGLDPEIQDPDYIFYDDLSSNWYGVKGSDVGLYANGSFTAVAAECVNGRVFVLEDANDYQNSIYADSVKLYTLPVEDMNASVLAASVSLEGNSGWAQDMAYSTVDHKLYALIYVLDGSEEEPPPHLFKIDPMSGAYEDLGKLGQNTSTLAIDDAGNFYGIVNVVNPDTLAETGTLYKYTPETLENPVEVTVTGLMAPGSFQYAATDWVDGKLIYGRFDMSETFKAPLQSIDVEAGTVQELHSDLGMLCLKALFSAKGEDAALDLDTPASAAEAVILSASSATVMKGSTLQLTAAATPWNLENREVTWKSGNTRVATVDANGLVKGVSTGTVTITAASKATPSVTATCEVTVKSIETDLNALVWDEEGKIWWSKFNTGKLPAYTKNKEVETSLQLAAAAKDGKGGMYAASLDTDTLTSSFYKINPTTMEATPTAETGWGGGAMDLAYSPAYELYATVYASYLILCDPETGDYYGLARVNDDNTNLYGVGIAYYTTVHNTKYDTDVDYFLVVDNAGNLYLTGFGYIQGIPELQEGFYTFGGLVDNTGYSTEKPYFNSLEYTTASDGNPYLFWSQWDGGDYVKLIAIDVDSDEGGIYELGRFPATVWPAAGLMSGSIPGNRSAAGRLTKTLAEAEAAGTEPLQIPEKAELEGLLTGGIEKTAKTAPAEAVAADEPNAPQGRAPRAGTGAAAGAAAVDPVAKTVTVPVEVSASSNGLFTLEYDRSVLTLSSAEYSGTALHSDVKAAGSFKAGYADFEEFTGRLVDLTFTYKAKPEDQTTEVTVKVFEDGATVTEEPAGTPVEITLPAGENTPVTPAPGPSGDNPVHDCPSEKFTDVDTSRWYHEAIDYVVENGLMYGETTTRFAPDTGISRAQIVTVLYRLAGSPAVSGSTPFTDVKANSYYADALVWAYQNKLAAGNTATTFAPNKTATREEMVSFFARFAKLSGQTVEAKGDLSAFKDAGSVSKYAVESMTWAVESGLIHGVSADRLSPKTTSTRAAVAQVLMEYCRKFPR